MSNPTPKLVDLSTLQTDLYQIQTQLEEAQEKIARALQSGSIKDHMQAGLALSSLEIHMSNFAVVLREKFR